MKNDKMLNLIIDKLKAFQVENEVLYGWKTSITKKRSCQRLLYSTPENELYPETIRDNINETKYSITVFTRKGKDMGNITFILDTMGPLTEQINSAIKSALFIKNKPWDLVKSDGRKLHEITRVDAAIKEDPAGTAAQLIRTASNSCCSLEGVNINYAELFLNYTQTLTVTSTGLKLPTESTDIYFEIAMEKLPLPNRQEIHNSRSSISVEDLELEEFIKQAARETSYLGKVELPATDNNAVILVKAEVINDIFHCLLEQVDVSREYMRRPFLKEKEMVNSADTSGDADRINLRVNPYIDLMAESCSFTGDGLKPLAGVIIEENSIKQRYVSNRMSQYLGYGKNPVHGNILLECGSRSYEELIKAAPRVIEIITFSSLLLNSDYLTFSSEIKLAREHNNQTGEVRYLKGGVVSGNIRENMNAPLFSNKKVKNNTIGNIFEKSKGYIGPEYMLLRTGVAVAGKS